MPAAAWAACVSVKDSLGHAVYHSAPPRGGRPKTRDVGGMAFVFQSTPPRGGRRPAAAGVRITRSFQSTPPRGGRRICWKTFGSLSVSIHAPAWGATDRPDFDVRDRVVSIHAPAWGATVTTAIRYPNRPVSIHAPAWGATDSLSSGGVQSNCFNPRPRVGGDRHQRRHTHLHLVSIHAPAWGATCQSFRRKTNPGVFQSTPPRGGRPGPYP